ncbi:MAG: peptidoglycan-binding protein [Chlorobaculum sp.]|nr:peptidoglycan-binding protein [Chlorobaculum sp.]
MAKVYFQRAITGFRAVRGELVSLVQVALKEAGSDPEEIDGIYGSDMEKALQDFQQKQNLEKNGKITEDTWLKLMGTVPPAILDRCLQLTGDFEGHGFRKVAGNFDGAGLTWGIIGFTLLHGEIQKILTEVQQHHPALLQQAFGSLQGELSRVLGLGRSAQIDWANSISLGSKKYRIDRSWEKAFDTLGTFPDVQAVQLREVNKYWNIAINDANHFGLKSEMGIALCFDIAVQNGGIDANEELRIKKKLLKQPGATERDKRIIIANVVAENSRAKYVEDVRRRKLTIATGDGTVHEARYATKDWGISEDPWQFA